MNITESTNTLFWRWLWMMFVYLFLILFRQIKIISTKYLLSPNAVTMATKNVIRLSFFPNIVINKKKDSARHLIGWQMIKSAVQSNQKLSVPLFQSIQTTQCANDCGSCKLTRNCMHTCTWYSCQPKQNPTWFLNVGALFFSKFIHIRNRVYQWNIQKNYCSNIFDHEGHNPWHTW